MILLDTNVVSEMMKPEPAPRVMQWLRGFDPEAVFTSTITAAELLAGVQIMPDGKRRRGIVEGTHHMLNVIFAERMLPFDLPAAEHYAILYAHRRQIGARIEPMDGQIAAIARANGMALATRNVKHFRECGVEIIDPWEP